MITFLMSIIIAYVLGSISCSILLAKFIKLPDPRETGSGNAGAANMMRLAGRNKAAVVLIGDQSFLNSKAVKEWQPGLAAFLL